MLYMTVWAIKHRTFVNNFAYETAEINIEVKHLPRFIDFLFSNEKLNFTTYVKKLEIAVSSKL